MVRLHREKNMNIQTWPKSPARTLGFKDREFVVTQIPH